MICSPEQIERCGVKDWLSVCYQRRSIRNIEMTVPSTETQDSAFPPMLQQIGATESYGERANAEGEIKTVEKKRAASGMRSLVDVGRHKCKMS